MDAASAKFGGMISSGKGVARVTSNSKTGRQLLGQYKGNGVSIGYTPHIGAKQIAKDKARFAKQQVKENKEIMKDIAIEQRLMA